MHFGPFSSNEGGLVLVLIYIITGIFGECSTHWILLLRTQDNVGPSFWDQRILTFARLDHIPQIVEIVSDIGLNEAFILFAASLLSLNIVSRYQDAFECIENH